MYINLETTDRYSIESYSDNEVRINATTYQHNLIVSSTELITHWSIESIAELDKNALAPLLTHQPEIILIGHTKPNLFAPSSTIQYLAQQHIALECMLIGPACRTFNVLLSEKRNVMLGIIVGGSSPTACV